MELYYIKTCELVKHSSMVDPFDKEKVAWILGRAKMIFLTGFLSPKTASTERLYQLNLN